MHKVNTKKKMVFFHQLMLYGSLQHSRRKCSKRALSDWVLNLLVFITLFTVFGFSHSAFSEEGGIQLTGDAKSREKIFGSYHFDNRTSWAVGAYGLIIKTTDGGKTWVQQKKITNKSLFDIFFVNKNKGWIVGDSGSIFKTEDGGSFWKEQEAGTKNDILFKVSFLDENRGIAVGMSGVILNTENGGGSWQVNPIDWVSLLPEELVAKGVLTPNLYYIFFINPTNGWIVGDGGVMLKTSDGGKHWNFIKSGFLNPFFSVFFKNESEGWVVGHNGFVIHTQDGGRSWVEIKIPVIANLFKIQMYDDEFGLIVGEKGTVLQTADGGLTWSGVKLNLTAPLPFFSDAWVVVSNSPKEIILLGDGIILETTIPK